VQVGEGWRVSGVEPDHPTFMINLIPRATVIGRRRAAWGRRFQGMVLVVGTFCLTTIAAAAAPDAAPEIVVRNLPQTVFAESEVVVELVLPEPAGEAKRIAWSLEATGGRALNRSEFTVKPGAASASVTCKFPPLKETVVLPLRFRAALEKSAAVAEKQIWVFPRSPWIRRRDAEARPKITLFDPEETIGKYLTEGEVAFEAITNLATLGERRESLVLVGEGVDFREYPGLASALWRAAAAGNRVVCLAPAGGSLPFAEEPVEPRPSSFSLRRADVIADFDARFDGRLWADSDGLPKTRFTPRGEGNVPSLEVTDDAGAWPWLEVRFASTGGKLVVCGFGLIEGWDASPTPRYLLAQLLSLDTPVKSVSTSSER
jgi:hypothetical protein